MTAADGIVTDTLGGTEVMIFATEAGMFAYKRDEISFQPTADGIRFRGNGTVWDPATGRSQNGRTLTRIPSRRLFAFTWRDDNGTDALYRTE